MDLKMILRAFYEGFDPKNVTLSQLSPHFSPFWDNENPKSSVKPKIKDFLESWISFIGGVYNPLR